MAIILNDGNLIEGYASTAGIVDFVINGLDGAQLKQLAEGQLPSTKSTLYTATGTDSIISIVLVNSASTSKSVNLFFKGAGESRRITPKNFILGAGYMAAITGKRLSVYDAQGRLQTGGAAGGNGATTFLDLSDTPASYATHGGKVVRVNADENALEFVVPGAPSLHAETHQSGGADEINLDELDGVPIALSNHQDSSIAHALAVNLEKTANKGQAGGYAALDSSGRIPVAQLGSGTPTGAKFLRDDRTWQIPEPIGGNPVIWAIIFGM